MPSPTITTPDNGYFEVWTCPEGHTYRVITEYLPRTNYGPRGKVRPESLKAARARTHEGHAHKWHAA
jgi:hypothetical protein